MIINKIICRASQERKFFPVDTHIMLICKEAAKVVEDGREKKLGMSTADD